MGCPVIRWDGARSHVKMRMATAIATPTMIAYGAAGCGVGRGWCVEKPQLSVSGTNDFSVADASRCLAASNGQVREERRT